MATCTKCGKWCGVVQEDHNYDCIVGARETNATDELVAKLRPVLMSAATRAGVAAAITLVLLGLIVAAVRLVIGLLVS